MLLSIIVIFIRKKLTPLKCLWRIGKDKDILKGHNFNKGLNPSYEKDGKYIVVKVLNNIPPGPKELSECRGQVIAAYQEQLEKEWISSLEKKYNVVIHEDVLYSLVK